MMSRKNLLPVTTLLAAVAALGAAQTRDPASLSPRERWEAARAAEAEARANSPFKSEEIMKLGQPKLIAILKDREAPVFAKAKACQRLALVGDKTAVPALAALLSDPKLAHYARFGLEPIPDPAVDQAFREALGKLKGKLLVGVINSIAVRKDPGAVDALGKLLHDDDPEVAQAAWAALGRIRSP